MISRPKSNFTPDLIRKPTHKLGTPGNYFKAWKLQSRDLYFKEKKIIFLKFLTYLLKNRFRSKNIIFYINIVITVNKQHYCVMYHYFFFHSHYGFNVQETKADNGEKL